MASDDNMKIAAFEKRMDEKFQVIANDMKEFKTSMARRFDEVRNALQEPRKSVDTMKNNGSHEQKDGSQIISATTETQESTKETPKELEETVLEKEESSSQKSKNQGTTTSSLGSQKSEVDTEHCIVQIWSKHNVSLALKMRGITVRWRRSRATQDSRIVSKKTSQRKGGQICNDEVAEPPPPKRLGAVPVVSKRVRTTSRPKRREEGQGVGNEPPPPPKPPDPRASKGRNSEANRKKRDQSWKEILSKIHQEIGSYVQVQEVIQEPIGITRTDQERFKK